MAFPKSMNDIYNEKWYSLAVSINTFNVGNLPLGLTGEINKSTLVKKGVPQY